VPSLSRIPRVHLSNIRDQFTQGIERQPLQIYDLIAYRSMQPHPLRDEVFRLQTEGEFVKNAPDVRGNIVKLTRLTSVVNQIEKEVPGYQIPKMPKKEK
jgi:hypothetical protein